MESTPNSSGNFENLVISALNRIAEAIENLSPSTSAQGKVSNEAKAIAALHILGPRITEIAQEVNVSRSTLYRYSNFMAAYHAFQKMREDRKRDQMRRTERGHEEE